jgi:hypothetical protein
LSLREELIAILNDLVCTAYEVHVMLLEEAGYNVRAEGEGDTTVILTPASDILVGIGPQEIAKKAAVGNLYWSAD